jgi:hypothetical protein
LKEVTFLLGIHNHQPVGNFDWVIENAYRDAYLPFLETVERHPGVRLAMHNSGVLLDWFEANHPEYLDRLARLVAGGQVELLTGGYYEPILPSISDADKVGQIRMLSRKLLERLGSVPRGLWLAERVWEPTLPVSLAEAQVDYVMVDDAHFLAAGCEADTLWNYWLTEDQGRNVAVWPISKALRYLVPFEPAARSIEFLKKVASGGGGRVALLADDGEKFGVWPDTHEQVFEKGWLEQFFSLIEANAGWLRMGLPGEELKRRPAAGRVYLPTASYSEMMEWALPTPVQRIFHAIHEKARGNGTPEARFVRGGFWRNFLAKYPESNLMHKRMLEERGRLDRCDLPDVERARTRDDLWQSQCNCAYWHGVFGGLYLPHLRDAIYRKILSAEARMNAHENPDRKARLASVDLDRDGFAEWRLSNGLVAGLVSPARGGALTEFDYFPKLRNFSHGMTRRPEAYHDRLQALAELPPDSTAPTGESRPTEGVSGGGSVRSIHDRVEMKEPGLEHRLFFDWYRRESLIDHFFRSDTTLEAFERSEYGEQGDFVDHVYEAEEEAVRNGRLLRLSRSGRVWVGGRAIPVRVEKSLELEDGAAGFQIEYQITQQGDATLQLWFGVEFNFTMLAGCSPDRFYTVDGAKPVPDPELAGHGSHAGARAVRLHDEWDRVTVGLDLGRPSGLWRLPVETITQSEAGFERVYQSSCVVPHWRITMKPGEPWRVTLRLFAEEEKRG